MSKHLLGVAVIAVLVAGCGEDSHRAASPTTAKADMAAHAAEPVTFVMCGVSATDGASDLYATRDGVVIRHLISRQRLASISAREDTAVVVTAGRLGINRLTRVSVAADGAVARRTLPSDRDMTGGVRLSRDGRWLAYVTVVSGKDGALQDQAVTVRADGGGPARKSRPVHAIADLDFDVHDRLHLLTQVAGAGSRIVTAGVKDQRLRQRAYVIRYGDGGRLAMSGPGWAEVRDAKGRVLARRRGIVVNGWARSGSDVLVLRLSDGRFGFWNWKTNGLRMWPRLPCAVPYYAEQ
ncbi:hypothetical protein [Conexibacter woesei]|uniref:hypothetical protein n=1 Tax=Conexibacter woesei TaxID=191495 RepID=UPI00047C2813|nr:hypothetical protein [Conexibacter woesei]